MAGLVSLRDASAQQAKPERGSPYENQKSFQSWLGDLPLANVVAVSNELVAGLQELNRSRVSTKFRAAALQKFLTPIKTEGALLDKEYRDCTFPLTDQVDRHGRVCIAFYRELAVGFRIVAAELSGQSSRIGVLSKIAACRAIHNALCCHEQYLLRLALLFQEVPPGVWSEIHTLYRFSQQNELQGKRARELFQEPTAKTTIEAVYKRLCLMGISDLRRLGQRSLRSLYQVIPLWVDRISLRQGGAREGLFEIQPDADEPPQLILNPVGGRPKSLLDVIQLRDWLRPMLDTAKSSEVSFPRRGGKPQVIDVHALSQVVTAWGERIERSFKRLPADHQIKMIVGINGIHYVTAGEVGLSQFIEDLGDINFFVSSNSNQNWITGADDRFRPVEYHADVVDQSVGGYRLRMTEMGGLHLRVGEIVSVCASSIANRDTTWLLATVRWIHAISTSEMEVGVAVLGHAVRAAAVLLPEDQSDRTVPPFRGLVINGFSEGDENVEHLLVPAFVSKAGVTAQLGYHEEGRAHMRTIRLESLEGRSSEVSRFSFSDQGDEWDTKESEQAATA